MCGTTARRQGLKCFLHRTNSRVLPEVGIGCCAENAPAGEVRLISEQSHARAQVALGNGLEILEVLDGWRR